MVFLLTTLLLAIVERLGWPHGLAVALVVARLAAGGGDSRWVMLSAFGAGVLVDLVFLNRLGVSALIFLGVRLGFLVINSVVGDRVPWTVGVAAVLVSVIELWLGGLPVIWWQLVIGGLAAMGFYGLFKRDFRGGDEVFLRRS